MRVFLWIIGFAIFAFAVFGICLAINGFMQKNFPRKDEWLLVYGGLLCCVTVVCTVVHFTYVYAMCGRQELFVSLEKLLFT